MSLSSHWKVFVTSAETHADALACKPRPISQESVNRLAYCTKNDHKRSDVCERCDFLHCAFAVNRHRDTVIHRRRWQSHNNTGEKHMYWDSATLSCVFFTSLHELESLGLVTKQHITNWYYWLLWTTHLFTSCCFCPTPCLYGNTAFGPYF